MVKIKQSTSESLELVLCKGEAGSSSHVHVGGREHIQKAPQQMPELRGENESLPWGGGTSHTGKDHLAQSPHLPFAGTTWFSVLRGCYMHNQMAKRTKILQMLSGEPGSLCPGSNLITLYFSSGNLFLLCTKQDHRLHFSLSPPFQKIQSSQPDLHNPPSSDLISSYCFCLHAAPEPRLKGEIPYSSPSIAPGHGASSAWNPFISLIYLMFSSKHPEDLGASLPHTKPRPSLSSPCHLHPAWFLWQHNSTVISEQSIAG